MKFLLSLTVCFASGFVVFQLFSVRMHSFPGNDPPRLNGSFPQHVRVRNDTCISFSYYSVLAVVVFLPKKFLDFWDILPRSRQLYLARYARFCKISQQDGGKNFKKFLRVLGKRTKNIQYLGQRNKKSTILARNSRLSKIIQDYSRFWQENQDD